MGKGKRKESKEEGIRNGFLSKHTIHMYKIIKRIKKGFLFLFYLFFLLLLLKKKEKRKVWHGHST